MHSFPAKYFAGFFLRPFHSELSVWMLMLPAVSLLSAAGKHIIPQSIRGQYRVSCCKSQPYDYSIYIQAMKSSDILIMSVSFLADFTRAVAVRPISYAAVLRMKQDSSSSLLNSRSRPRPHGGGGPATPDWPVFQSHPLPALSLLSSQEDYRSEGKLNLLCCYLLLSDVCSELSPAA